MKNALRMLLDCCRFRNGVRDLNFLRITFSLSSFDVNPMPNLKDCWAVFGSGVISSWFRGNNVEGPRTSVQSSSVLVRRFLSLVLPLNNPPCARELARSSWHALGSIGDGMVTERNWVGGENDRDAIGEGIGPSDVLSNRNDLEECKRELSVGPVAGASPGPSN